MAQITSEETKILIKFLAELHKWYLGFIIQIQGNSIG